LKFVHTCYRVLDLERSKAFYEALGFEERGRLPIGDEAVNLYMGLPDDGDRVELTCNIGRTDPYEIGTGYGHFAVSVERLDEVLANLEERGIAPEKPPYQVNDGGPRLCFVRDPDGYRIELIEGMES
jgi:lactoylglutathione lyase